MLEVGVWVAEKIMGLLVRVMLGVVVALGVMVLVAENTI
jgi:hypothetical protein